MFVYSYHTTGTSAKVPFLLQIRNCGCAALIAPRRMFFIRLRRDSSGSLAIPDFRYEKHFCRDLYNKLDGFLVLIQRHESEIAALRSAHDRLEERLQKLEARFA